LARWIHRQLILKFTFANITKPFEMRFSTICRDSGMLSNYSRARQARDACDYSVKELETQKILLRIVRKEELGARGKVLDIVYVLHPSSSFVKEVKAANARSRKGGQ
jgi:hypothetical protein